MDESGRTRTRVVFVFLDGVGLAPAGVDNPLSQVAMPQVRSLLGGPLVANGTGRDVGGLLPWGGGKAVQKDRVPETRGEVLLRALDACLGVPGLPQSATGQTALFTGINAPQLVGDHVSAYPTRALREVIAGHSLLKRVEEAGGKVLFANAHSERFWEMIRTSRRRMGASTLTAMAAGAPIPTLTDLREGRAVLWDITHEVAWRHLGYELPVVAPEEAGRRLARLGAEHDLVLYESFLTDLAGHRRIEAAWVLSRIDAFLGALAAHRTADMTLVVCSDHGNLEDARTKSHTTNPVPLLVVGPAATRFSQASDITEVAPIILSLLSKGRGRGSRPGEAGPS